MSSVFTLRPTTCAVIPSARNSAAAAHRSGWQLSASSWISSSVRGPASRGSDLAASRRASVIGPRPRGLNCSSGAIKLGTSSGSGVRTTSTSEQSPRRCPNKVRPTRACGDILPSPRRSASRASTSLVCRTPSIGPHMEPDPSTMTISEPGSAASAAWGSSTAQTGPKLQRPTGSGKSLRIGSPDLSGMMRSRRHCTRDQVGLARVEFGWDRLQACTRKHSICCSRAVP